MNCLHGEPCAHTTTENGLFWFCNQAHSCNFFCSFAPENEAILFEKAIAAWKATNTAQPICGKLTKMCVVKDLIKANYGRPFFVCSNKSKPCSLWAWGNVKPLAKPNCRHNIPCAIRKVKKEAINNDRLFFNCSKIKKIRANILNGYLKNKVTNRIIAQTSWTPFQRKVTYQMIS